MAQVKIYGLKDTLSKFREKLSDIIQSCLVDALAFPREKKFQRFIGLEKEEYYYSLDRTENYIIIEMSVFEGRSVEAKKELIRLLYERIEQLLGIAVNDIEITIFETPKQNWGIRGVPGDELDLNYKVNV